MPYEEVVSSDRRARTKEARDVFADLVSLLHPQMEDLRTLEVASKSSESGNLYQELQLELSTCQALAACNGRELTLGSVLEHFDADRSALWRVLTWRVLFDQPDELVRLMSSKERALAHLQTHYA